VEKKWYVVYTKPRWEKKVATNLTDKGIENYCPLNKVTRQWSDRKKIVIEPLFKGYVFVCIEGVDKWDLKKVYGVLNYVHWLGKPAVVKNKDIEMIRKFLNEFTDVEVTEYAVIATQDKVVIKQGVFMNYKGIVLEVIGNKVRVKLETMGIVLNAVFEKKNLEKVQG
jgi:transcription antitermination factor NusG